MLGTILAESGGEDLLADVERLRHAVIGARDGAAVPGEEITRLVASWPLERAKEVARAFTVYFHLVNLAEEHHRMRALRERDDADNPPRESLAAAVRDIRAELGEDRLRELVAGMEFHPVLTAHPTEARRRAVSTSIQRVSAQLERLRGAHPGSSEEAEAHRRLLEEIDLLWRTSQLRSTRLDPLDEVRTAMAAFDETIFRVVPEVYRTLDTAVDPEGVGLRPSRAKPFVRYGSWIGGDRDGNPFVTHEVTREAIAIQSEHVLRALENVCGRIGRTLTVAAELTPASGDLLDTLATARAGYPRVLGRIAKRSPDEPHRQLLLYAAERLRATRERNADLAYPGPEALLADLRVVQESLAAAGAVRQAYGELQHLIWQAETFGFHLAELEIRQHSGVHARALAELRAGEEPSEQTAEVLATLRVVAWIQERFGVDACRRYVVSFTQSAEDVANVYELARRALPTGRAPVLDVVPLFETGADLEASPRVLDGMLELPEIQHRLAATGGRLEVMLGYSDSAKDVGPVSATLRLYDAQAQLADWAQRHDVRLTLFHGRGGALGRGGGPANRAVLAQAPGSVAGRFKVTEQGEVIFARYGQRAIARRHVEQVGHAVLMASTPAVQDHAAAAAERFRGTADRIAEAAHTAYRALIDTDGFAEWFSRVSPLEELGDLRLGSRPSRRSAARGLADLRAIPWVFAWTQTRVNLPGWYGLGSGLAAVSDLDELHAAYQEWPLFASLLDNAEMSLAKTDRTIAGRYLALGDRPELTERVLAEYDRTRDLVLRVTRHRRLLENRTVLSRAVDLRNPYVDALSHLQLRALEALRTESEHLSEGDHEHLEQLLLLSVNGVAAGLQNTG
ncbi:phosphoenolpyruvate carboxylase [Marinitenerispora sediminis]|uniref:Phosphoenolpyruvate carboxylase n=2 Tax=Marinitenerispora sediminis TaxID=1931232 RepID=A0A368T450_9ACTN|nr:phosphoenolpyruvate carboxylase [Marinitenerispora sediminis]RCV49912.1 phosphoenolpyruvate carboxylase [Marinitenerispora sediminis]RCV52823.1 phosphoenolpyruvate carboxylase [Marinitenerispora sediminis]